MEQARALQFQTIREQNYLERRSIMIELSSMQESFHQMLKKFADNIQANKELTIRKPSMRTSLASPMSPTLKSTAEETFIMPQPKSTV